MIGARASNQTEALAELDEALQATVLSCDPKPVSIDRKLVYSTEELAAREKELTTNELFTRKQKRLYDEGIYAPGFPAQIEIIGDDTPAAKVLPIKQD